MDKSLARRDVKRGRPRRSALYMPGANARALEKARGIPADVLLLDLEDAVAPDAKETARARLGLADSAFTVLLLGGGEGMGPVAATAHAVARRLAETGTAAQLVVICGRNKRLRQSLQRSEWPIPAQVCGFVDNMQEWMAASDCVITKAGPGTIAEALIGGLPILLSGFIPGQEEGNVSYVVENGAGAYCDTPDGIADIVSDWAGGSELAQMADRARELGRPRAAYDIVDEIVKLMDGEIAESRDS